MTGKGARTSKLRDALTRPRKSLEFLDDLRDQHFGPEQRERDQRGLDNVGFPLVMFGFGLAVVVAIVVAIIDPR